jgi:hypothetical protein
MALDLLQGAADMINTIEVEQICEGGFGEEAHIDVQLRREYPGIGGVIYTYQALAVALRAEYHHTPLSGHKMFCKHAAIKKLEDYFFKKGIYRYAHVTRPLGSTDDAYIYEWAFGLDTFPWEYVEADGQIVPVQLDEWDRFTGAFSTAGIDMSIDCTDPHDGRISKNIVHQLARPLYAQQPRLNRIWKRVDFGSRSVYINYDKLSRFLSENEEDLRATLTVGRFEFLEIASRYLNPAQGIVERDLGRLEQLILDYRLSTLSHLNTRGVEKSLEVHLIKTN